MFEKLDAIEEKYEQINAKLFEPDVVSDIKKYKKLMQEVKHLTPIVEKYRELKKAKKTTKRQRLCLTQADLTRTFAKWSFSKWKRVAKSRRKRRRN